MDEKLTVLTGGTGLVSLLHRALSIDASTLVRWRQLTPAEGEENSFPVVDVFVHTPFEVVASRRVYGTVSRDGAVVSAQALLDGLQATDIANASEISPKEVSAGTPRDPSWPGALPPATGFQLIDNLPVTVVRELADQGQQLARQFSGPLGPPSSLMNQTVVTAETADKSLSVDIPMRMIFACTSLGLIPGFSAPMDVPRHVRVSGLGRWIRLDAPFGTVYRSTRLSPF